MSKSVKIPEIGANPYVVVVDGVRYAYTGGATATVPDAVAEVIAHDLAMRPKADPDIWDKLPATLGELKAMIAAAAAEAVAAATELPKVTNTDNGKVAGVSGGKWAAVAPVDYSDVEVPFTVTVEDDTPTAGTTASFATVAAAKAAGKTLVAAISFPEEDPVTVYAPLRARLPATGDVEALLFSAVVDLSGTAPQQIQVLFSATGVDLSLNDIALDSGT